VRKDSIAAKMDPPEKQSEREIGIDGTPRH
jgi:hypothetical protein